MAGVEHDPFDQANRQRQKYGPQKSVAPGPGGNEQQPGVNRRVPDGHGGDAVKQHQGHFRQRHVGPHRSCAHAVGGQDDRAQHPHDELHDDDGGETDGRNHHQRNAEFRQHGGEIGNRQGLPKQNAAVAAFAVQRVQAVKPAHQETGKHDQRGGERVRRRQQVRLGYGIHRFRGAHTRGQMESASPKAEEHDGGGDQRGEVDRAVLPQLAAHRPVQGPRSRGGGGNGRNHLGVERLGIRWRVHRAAPGTGICAAPCGAGAGWPMTATNKSAMLGVCTSPRAASCW